MTIQNLFKAVFVKLRQNVHFETRLRTITAILEVELVIWKELSKNFGYILYSIRVEIIENILNKDSR